MQKPILDVCCGSRMFYFDKNNPNVCFMLNALEIRYYCQKKKQLKRGIGERESEKSNSLQM